MKKKLLTVALAAVMVVSSALSAFAATETELTAEGFLSASTTPEKVSGDFDVTYTFHNETTGTANWNNFIFEIKTQDDQLDGVTFRADRCGWGFGEYADDLGGDWGPSVVWNDVAGFNWDTFATEMKNADVVLNLKRTGNVFTFDYKITAGETTYNVIATTPEIAGLEADLQITLSGELVKLTNIKYVDNNATTDNNAGTTTPSTDNNAGTTTPSTDNNAGTTTPNTGDYTMVGLLLAVAAVSAVVVLKRRTVAE